MVAVSPNRYEDLFEDIDTETPSVFSVTINFPLEEPAVEITNFQSSVLSKSYPSEVLCQDEKSFFISDNKGVLSTTTPFSSFSSTNSLVSVNHKLWYENVKNFPGSIKVP